MRIVLSIAVVVLVIVSNAQGHQGTSPSPDVSPEVTVQRFVDAANARNADAMAALVAPDAVFARFLGARSSFKTVTGSMSTMSGNCSL